MTRAAGHLLACLKRLRVWESMRVDLGYPAGDPRGVMPDDEMPPEWHRELVNLQRAVTLAAACVAGETVDDAATFADTPTSTSNPYNLDRVRLAVAITQWRL